MRVNGPFFSARQAKWREDMGTEDVNTSKKRTVAFSCDGAFL